MARDELAARIVLTPMAPGRDEEFAAMLEEFRAAGELHVYSGGFAVAWQGYAPFYSLLMQMKHGGAPTPEIVPMDSYFIEAGGRILGEIYLRHRLTPHLEKIGGHIGYKVRPSRRNCGVATAALRLALGKLRAESMAQALVTCNTTNAASARVIEKCGGVRIGDAQLPGRVERRYWVPTASEPAAG
ncbi:MAG TPA: GNAT family N-acetyltransferase [Terracidiphilus sp.]|nr:GNAT family N-acetyltransferase [Terracidiphilus sp.]